MSKKIGTVPFFIFAMVLGAAACSDSDDGSSECYASLLSSCAVDEYCEFPEGSCGHSGEAGECVTRPQECITLFDPVCGCDFVEYSNGCAANAAGVSVANQGVCPQFPID